MSYQAQNTAALNNQLKVQELTLTTLDSDIISVDGADLIVKVREPLDVLLKATKTAAAGTITGVARASLTRVDSDNPAIAGKQDAIRVAATTLAAGDVLEIKYTSQK